MTKGQKHSAQTEQHPSDEIGIQRSQLTIKGGATTGTSEAGRW